MESKVEPLRRSLRLQLKAQNRDIGAETVNPPAEREIPPDVRTRFKGIPAQKKVDSRPSSSDSFMSGTAHVVPKPKAQRAGRVKYSEKTLPKPPCLRSQSSSSEDTQPGDVPRSTGNPAQPGPSAMESAGEKLQCSVCGRWSSHYTSAWDPRIPSAFSQVIAKIGPYLNRKRKQTCNKCGIQF